MDLMRRGIIGEYFPRLDFYYKAFQILSLPHWQPVGELSTFIGRNSSGEFGSGRRDGVVSVSFEGHSCLVDG
jgi:hypothetical protein